MVQVGTIAHKRVPHSRVVELQCGGIDEDREGASGDQRGHHLRLVLQPGENPWYMGGGEGGKI